MQSILAMQFCALCFHKKFHRKKIKSEPTPKLQLDIGHTITTLPQGTIACSCNAIHPTVCALLTWYILQGSYCYEGINEWHKSSLFQGVALQSHWLTTVAVTYLLVPVYTLVNRCKCNVTDMNVAMRRLSYVVCITRKMGTRGLHFHGSPKFYNTGHICHFHLPLKNCQFRRCSSVSETFVGLLVSSRLTCSNHIKICTKAWKLVEMVFIVGSTPSSDDFNPLADWQHNRQWGQK